MGKKQRQVLPPEVRERLERIEADLLEAMSDPTAGGVEVAQAAQEALTLARLSGERSRAALPTSKLEVLEAQTVIGWNVRQLRDTAKWTQARLSEAMAMLGFDWKRITVAEVESGARRTSFEELLGVSILFGVPALELLLPPPGVAIRMPNGVLRGELVESLVRGTDGDQDLIGVGGVEWAAARFAAPVIGRDDWRPAPDYWNNRTGAKR